ncbi:fimbrial biogenesis usher protein [Enterobacter sp. FR 78]|uniref:fimbrial biogenesis usher protein n=1 Tax=Enterobacter TaxID=547 RepID=UPI0009005865|nr:MULTISPECIES: fimbrial biogenesis usher protein [Enterobacter]MDD9579903.1 fimbrial biogenesis usher protein [Enterobacter sp. FR 78]MDX7661117.1 fimbrial biogenesis usher protein [Enterobacter asburiae]
MKPENITFKIGIVCSVLLCAAIDAKCFAADNMAEFDKDVLKTRGLDSALSDYFADKAKFAPGRSPVTLYVNGKNIGSVTARFDNAGELCVDNDFLTAAGLQIPDEISQFFTGQENQDAKAIPEKKADTCFDYKKYYPTAIIIKRPGQERLDLIVPEEAQVHDNMLIKNYQKGGAAGLLNYDVFTTKNTYSNDQSHYTQASAEEGLNFNDWLLRSRQIFTNNDGQLSNDALYTYVQHTFVDQQALVQAGQIYISNTLFSGSAISGVQMVPEAGLNVNSGSGVTVKGIAQGPQARVEVRQNGALVYSTLVPAGPFSLSNVPITSVNTPLDVKVKETDGSENHYVIPAESLHPNQLGGPQGFSIAAGKLRDIDSNDELPYLLTASKGWKISPWMNVSAGGLTATKYNALAFSADVSPVSETLLSSVIKASQDSKDDNKGTEATLSASYSPGNNISLSAAASHFTSGYRELADTLQDDFIQYSGQYSGNVGWSNNILGSFNLGYSLNKGSKGESDTRYVTVAWGKTFSRFSITANWQSQLNRDDNDNDNRNTNADMFYVNMSVPIGSQRVGAYMRKQGDSEHSGLQSSGTISPEVSYSIAAERDMSDNENSFDGSLSDNLHFTQLGLNAGTTGNDNKNYGARLSGGVLAHSKGVTFSSYPIDDTFALVSLDEKVSNVEISTPSGDVWTDRWGRAVIPSLPAYHNARIEINTETLPKNIDVNNGISIVASGHGAVSQVHFGVINTRRIMLHVSRQDNGILTKGSSVVDSKGNYVATAIEDGLVFLSDVQNLPALYAVDEQGRHQCQLHFKLPEKQDLNNFYEDITGVCQ